ncbi:hypothetical protein O0235_01030 [Tepidiforma flava]|uniref:Uncharacterized protein n=1 Tax=Tepidiforma flava TaxID=3004094 RepID=A0ABY7MCG2_9CHLR|nr:hypothetical protein [Tepidiforma flava]WBL37587.1 hypothetical protein O0235_01030 [Tepidiforma flava]
MLATPRPPEPGEDGPDVADDCRAGADRRDFVGIEEVTADEGRDGALGDIEDHDDGGGNFAGGAEDVGGAGLAAAGFADIAAEPEVADDEAPGREPRR